MMRFVAPQLVFLIGSEQDVLCTLPPPCLSILIWGFADSVSSKWNVDEADFGWSRYRIDAIDQFGSRVVIC